jgi:molecular chaperone DnaK
MKMGQSIYEKEQASASAPAEDAGAATGGGAEEEVVDAEFSEVDEDAKN